MAPQIGKIVPEGGTTVVEGWGMIQQTYLGTAALFSSILIGLLSTEIFVRLSKVKKLTIKCQMEFHQQFQDHLQS